MERSDHVRTGPDKTSLCRPAAERGPSHFRPWLLALSSWRHTSEARRNAALPNVSSLDHTSTRFEYRMTENRERFLENDRSIAAACHTIQKPPGGLVAHAAAFTASWTCPGSSIPV